MEYLARRFDERTDPATYLPDAASVICVAINYHVPLEPVPEQEHEQPPSLKLRLANEHENANPSR